MQCVLKQINSHIYVNEDRSIGKSPTTIQVLIWGLTYKKGNELYALFLEFKEILLAIK